MLVTVKAIVCNCYVIVSREVNQLLLVLTVANACVNPFGAFQKSQYCIYLWVHFLLKICICIFLWISFKEVTNKNIMLNKHFGINEGTCQCNAEWGNIMSDDVENHVVACIIWGSFEKIYWNNKNIWQDRCTNYILRCIFYLRSIRRQINIFLMSVELFVEIWKRI
jgi:hypothetical protein